MAQAVTRAAGPAKTQLGMHMTTTVAAGFRGSLEGWARAGIKYCEFTSSAVDAFLKTEDVAAARRLIADLGLTPVSCGSVVGLWEPNPKRAATIDSLKQRCEMYSSLGLKQIDDTNTSTVQGSPEDDLKGMGLDNMREVGEIVKQYPMTAMVEFSRGSTFIGTLSTSLQMTRDAAHPNVRPMFDCYHFWAGQSKFEDLDLIRPGEISHVHFQDVPADLPRELLGQTTRVIPGDGITPLARILRKLSEKGYAGMLSVELFRPEFQNADPFELASRIRQEGRADHARGGRIPSRPPLRFFWSRFGFDGRGSVIFFSASCLRAPPHNIRHRVVAFVAGVFVNRTGCCHERIFQRPLFGERRGIVDRGAVENGLWVDTWKRSITCRFSPIRRTASRR